MKGDKDGEIQERIVGGHEVTCEEFPYQVNFIVNNSYFCGGFIVSDRYILTAAHCAQKYVTYNYSHLISINDNRKIIFSCLQYKFLPIFTDFNVQFKWWAFLWNVSNIYIQTVYEHFTDDAYHYWQQIIFSVDPSTVVLRSGSTFRKNGTIIPIEEVTPYPGYDKPPFDKDIAVMKTTNPIEFGRCTQPIPITPKGETPQPGTEMAVSGWGRTRVRSWSLHK